MSGGAQVRGEALESALGRLPWAVIVFDERQVLRPLNRKAEIIFETEALRGDLVAARPSHPLAELIAGVLHSDDELPATRTFTFPSGTQYRVETSRRSKKGLGRLIVLLFDRLEERGGQENVLDRWRLTEREREVAALMMGGHSSPEICEAMGIADNTLRSHVKAILEKTGSRNRADFLAKLLRSR